MATGSVRRRVLSGGLCTVLTTTALALLAGCGSSLSHTIDKKQLRDMSRQGARWVYDAENELVVALDRLDEAKDALARVRTRIEEAEEGVESAEKGRAGLVRVAEAWLVHLEALEKWAEESVKLQRFGLLVARAAVELAKAQVIQREDLLGGKDFSVKDYQDQYNQLKATYDRRAKRVRSMRKAARKKEARWWRLRRRYVARTGDYDSGLWTQ